MLFNDGKMNLKMLLPFAKYPNAFIGLFVLFIHTAVFAADDIYYSDYRSYVISAEPFLTAGIALGDIDEDGV